MVKVVEQGDWVEITAFWHDGQGWQHRSIRITLDEFEGLKKELP
jgi:hypothetical protein